VSDISFEAEYQRHREKYDAEVRRRQADLQTRADEESRVLERLSSIEHELSDDIQKFLKAIKSAQKRNHGRHGLLSLKYWVLIRQTTTSFDGDATTGSYRSALALDSKGRLWWADSDSTGTKLKTHPSFPWEPSSQELRSAMVSVLVEQGAVL
jgi:hypothetical protein